MYNYSFFAVKTLNYYSFAPVGMVAGLAATVTILFDKVNSLIMIYNPAPMIKIFPR